MVEKQVVGHKTQQRRVERKTNKGRKVLIRIGKAGWKYKEAKGKVTLFPSLGNWELPCRSHYSIRQNKVKWSGDCSDEEIEEGRQSDMEKKRQYFENLNRQRKK